MMRTSLQPLAHLVDAAAQKWLAAEHASESQRNITRTEITNSFRIGDRPEMTFHGRRYLLSIIRNQPDPSGCSPEFRIEAHKIALNN